LWGFRRVEKEDGEKGNPLYLFCQGDRGQRHSYCSPECTQPGTTERTRHAAPLLAKAQFPRQHRQRRRAQRLLCTARTTKPRGPMRNHPRRGPKIRPTSVARGSPGSFMRSPPCPRQKCQKEGAPMWCRNIRSHSCLAMGMGRGDGNGDSPAPAGTGMNPRGY
jgi:hypothetical protein